MQLQAKTNGYIIAWSMQVKSEDSFSIQRYPLACLHHFSTSEYIIRQSCTCSRALSLISQTLHKATKKHLTVVMYLHF